MTTRRRLAVGLGGGVLAVALAGVVVLLRWPDYLGQRCDQIREGMTRQEVERVMAPYRGEFLDGGLGLYSVEYSDGWKAVAVTFDLDDDRVFSKGVQDSPSFGTLAKLQALLRRLGP